MSQMDATMTEPIPTPSDFPVDWADPMEARFFWVQDRMHYPDVVGPLAESFEFKTFNIGAPRAFERLNVPIRPYMKVINGYAYTAMKPISFDPTVFAEAGHKAEKSLQASMMGFEHIWQSVVLPEILADVATLHNFDYAAATDAEIAEHLDWLEERRARHWDLHFQLMLPALLALVLFEKLYRQLNPSSDDMEPYTLLQGLPNKTIGGNIALYRLGQTAGSSVLVKKALTAGEPAAVFARLEETVEGRKFAGEMRAYLEQYGWRGDSLNMDDRTWVDYPLAPLDALRNYLANPETLSPEKERQRLAEQREKALSRVRGVLANQAAPVRGQFEGFLKTAQLANTLHEDHNFYIDQMLQHLARRAFVEVGNRLTRRDQLSDTEDVLLLTFDELRGALTRSDARDFRPLVAARRDELAHWRTVAAPPVLGTPQPPPPPGHESPLEIGIARFFGGPPQRSANAREIRGNAGSRGKVTGTARVALTLEDATALQSGEILVCPTTSASWTPMFAVAAAIVTDTGGILSHCAVVAREFGIPAVVGTQVATQAIQSGQRITVDGSAGVVTVESKP